jgi:tetratricopeptide (TPR) repeat protein
LRLLEAAARRASKVGSPSAGVRYLEAALEFAEADTDRARLLESAAQAAADSGRFEQSIRFADEAIGTYVAEGDEVGAGRTAAIEGLSLSRLGNPGAGIELMMAHWRGLKDSNADDAVQPLASALSKSHQDRGDYALSLEFTFRALAIAEAHGDLEAMAHSYTSLAYYHLTMGAPKLAMLLIERTADLGREMGNPAVLARASMVIGAEKRAEDPVEAVRIGREALASAELSGVQTIVELSQVNLLLALWISGEWDELDTKLLEFADLPAGIEVIRVATGHWLAEARQHDVRFSASQELRPEADEVVHRAWWSHLELLEHRSNGRLSHAVAAGADSVASVLAYTGLTDDFTHLWPPAVLTAIEAGDLDAAAGLMAYVDEAPVGLRTPVLEAYLHQLRGLLSAARGLDAEAEADLRRAVDLFIAYGSPPLLGQAQESLGRWLCAQGRVDEARDHLAAARSIYLSLGAEGWLAGLDDAVGRAAEPRAVAETLR